MKLRNKIQKLCEWILKAECIFPYFYKLLFEYIYLTNVSEVFYYIGTYAKPNVGKGVLSWFVFVLIDFGIKRLPQTDLKFLLEFLYTISIIPTMSVYWMKDESTTAFFLICMYWLIWIAATLLFSRRERVCVDGTKLGIELSSRNVAFRLCFLWLLASTVYFSARYGGFRLFIPLEDVYTYRLAEGNRMGTLEGYLFSWNSFVFIPICMILHLRDRRYICFMVDAVLCLMSYSIYGNKIILFSMMLVLGIWILWKLKLTEHVNAMIQLVMCIVFIGMTVLPFPRMLTALIHRIFSVPAEAHFFYFDFFQNHEYLYLRESVVGRFTGSPYPVLVSIMIGSDPKYYLTGNYNNANNGCFSDAYQNFGVVGVMIYPVLIVATSKWLSNSMHKHSICVRYTMLAISALYLYSAYYFSWLLTGGVLVLVMINKAAKWFEKRRITMGRISFM